MTKEERAEKWFSNIPGAESISIERKIEICDKLAKKMMIIILGLVALEFILLFMVGGEILTKIADFFNHISEGGHTGNHSQGLALTGIIVFLPVFIIPLTAAFTYKNNYLKAELAKIVIGRENTDSKESTLPSFTKEGERDILHFDTLNFKLAIIQVLMYDLHLLKPEFDLYAFADQYQGEKIDTDSDTIIEPALNFFKKMEIPKKLAAYVEMLYMDGGNDLYMNIIPQWDGEDDSFDLNEITLAELQQFPNLKKATLMSSNFDKIKEVFDALSIEVELL
ncbi:DUF6892 domain-containing protein [Oribacterium sinus]|uniref:DUF6892 domain-containing protein n=1 Tax=Oribacterium sinus TaxID=237576 RepID=UPI0028F01748|nr:hypothetical protein [Oribacterium sinus]